jgi:hypothetical protein
VTSLRERLLSTVAGPDSAAVGEIAAALQNSCLQVEQHWIDEKPMPRYLFIGRRD